MSKDVDRMYDDFYPTSCLTIYSIPLGIPPSFVGLANRGFSPLSVGYSGNSPCPGAESTEPESDGAKKTIYVSNLLEMEGVKTN